ncbi:protein phosphatase 2C domain-containing protein [Corynebacterium cystitidis]|uniref:Serine/threonine protein phosphatase PrpC n=1 Tax=Corynebacterium cystitidis DSM 20524 TaxID=1121357 RepID=A0A1H9TTD9_9CORY|nr:protein phosphatase 2C domain-containing protein [Corynebacterium cystitidis]WJY81951.1 hypothetical protein CCYS_05040 [Corynebacterium cystitidis DSM 20524]SES00590.1 Serine/threonine protein phosphatase PrpC [Corynebacterium cystitidis DSM 20524]SNV81655.1 Uncharacterised protein [Corynebacterium cystitidis]
MGVTEALRVQGASVPGSGEHPNEDAWGTSGDSAWVIDGASQPDHQRTDPTAVARFVEDLNRALAVDEPLALRDRLSRAIQAIDFSQYPAAPDAPSATIAMARVRNNLVEWLVLGDSGIVLSDDTVHRDLRLSSVGRTERESVRHLRRGGATIRELRRAQNQLASVERAARNRPGGFWVVSDDPRAVDQAFVGTHQLGPEQAVLLATDGFLDVVNPLQLAWGKNRSPEDLIRVARHSFDTNEKVDDATVVIVGG